MVEDIGRETLRERDPKKLIPAAARRLIKNEQDVHLFERLAFMARPKDGDVSRETLEASFPRKRRPIFQRPWLWVPAFAGTTAACVDSLL
jgi:hypothetical protein